MGFGSSNSTQSSEPWKAQQPFLEDIYNQAQSWYQGQSPLAGSSGLEQSLFNRAQSEVDGSPTEQALGQFLQGSLSPEAGANSYQDAIGAAGGASNPYVGASNPYTGGIGAAGGAGNPYLDAIGASGERQNPYLDNIAAQGGQNPYLDQTFGRASDAVSQRFREDVLPGINASFGAAGRTGGGLHAQAFTDAAGKYGDTLNNLATDIYGGAYESDANRRLQRDVTAGQLGEAGLLRGLQGATDRGRLAEAGLQRGLQGASSAAGFGAADLTRSAGLAGADLDRALQGATTQGGLDNTSSALQLGAAGMVPGYEGLRDRNVSDLGQFAHQDLGNLQAYRGLLNPALVQSQGGAGQSGFSLK